MDVEEVRRILFSRVQSSDAENAFKIMGYLLLQDWAEQELIMLALGSDEVLHAMVSKARAELGLHMNHSNNKPGSAGWSRAVQPGSVGHHGVHGSFGAGAHLLDTLEGGAAVAAPAGVGPGQLTFDATVGPRQLSFDAAVGPRQLSFDATVGPRQLSFDAAAESPVAVGQLSPMAATSSSSSPVNSPATSGSMSMMGGSGQFGPSSNGVISSGSSNSPPMMMMMASTASDSMVSFYTSNHNLGSNYNTTIVPPKLNGSIGTRPIIPYLHTTQQWCGSSSGSSSSSNALAPPPTLPASSVLSLFNDKAPAFNYNMASEEHHLLHQHSSNFYKLHHSSSSSNNNNSNNNNNNNSNSNNNNNSSSMNMSSITRSCLFFSRGYCKHGNTCRFSHHFDGPDRYNANMASLHGDVEVDSSGSDDGYSFAQQLGFESFEMELRELLKGKKVPVSIASLPQMYYERFGKSLQAEGYLTESQRHGKAGFSLTRLLMRLKGTVRLIERPHGQHAVMLLEEGLHLSNEGGRRGPEDLIDSMNASSRQIYLTFPAESSFSEEDVTIHFRAYGPVQDVRIPHQQKRMFGFVTFIYPDTVRTILTEGNPHYICGARVLVKPYKEKGKKSSSGLVHKERQDIHLILQEERLNIELPVVEQKLGQLEMTGNEPKGEAVLNPIGTKLDTSDFDLAGDIAHDGSLLSSNFKFVLDLLEGESKDVEISDSTMVSVSGTNSKALNLKLGGTDNNTTDTVTATSLQKVRSNLWSTQNTHAGQYGWGATTLFARDVF